MSCGRRRLAVAERVDHRHQRAAVPAAHQRGVAVHALSLAGHAHVVHGQDHRFTSTSTRVPGGPGSIYTSRRNSGSYGPPTASASCIAISTRRLSMAVSRRCPADRRDDEPERNLAILLMVEKAAAPGIL